jgi:hypothetical protein
MAALDFECLGRRSGWRRSGIAAASLWHTPSFRLAQQQQPGIRGLIASVETYCDFPTVNGWQVEGKRRIFGHGDCGAPRLDKAIRLDTDLLCEPGTSRYSRRKISTDDELSGLVSHELRFAGSLCAVQ